jgi:hypothetical protein
MNAITKLEAVVFGACLTCAGSVNASSWWDDDDYDRWYDGPWYGGYPGYGWGGYPGYGWGGYPGYGWGGYPGYGWGGHRGYGDSKTIIVYPRIKDSSSEPPPEPRLPK